MLFILSCAAPAVEQSAAPKKILVVSTSTRNRFQGSVDAAEKALTRLAEKSHAFTLEFVQQPKSPKPKKPKPPVPLKAGASAEEQAAFSTADADYKSEVAAYADAEKKFDDEMKQSLQKLSPDSLKNYDGVVFCYTTGDLPLPDFDGFLAWIKAGHAFIGFDNALETMVSYPAYYDMVGATWSHFKGTQGWTDTEIVNQDSKHPANKGLPARWPVRMFSYKIWNFFLSDPAHTRELLAVEKSPTDQMPGHFPQAWCRDYGQGRVFYTGLGGSPDFWDAGGVNRKNPPETANLFQAHLLGGILWALKLDPAPGNSPGGSLPAHHD